MKKLSILFLICSIIFAQDSIEALIQEDNTPKAPMQKTPQEDPLGELNAPQPQNQSNIDALIQESSPSTPTLPTPQEREEIDLPIKENDKKQDSEVDLESLSTQATPKQKSAPLPQPQTQTQATPPPIAQPKIQSKTQIPEESSQPKTTESITPTPQDPSNPPETPTQPNPLDDISQDSQKSNDSDKILSDLKSSEQEAPQEAPQEIPDESPQALQIPEDQKVQEKNLSSDENKMNPKFFDYNKNHQKEALRALTAEEIKAKSNQCEDMQDKKVCFEVGMAYYQGRSVYGQNLKQALYFLDRSCDEQNGFGCYEAGIISAKNQSYQHSFIFLEKSCQSGDLRGCKNLGILYYNGQGTPKNIYKATEIFKTGCNKGDKLACQKLYLAIGNAYQDSLNYNGAKKNFQQACDLGEAQACQKIQVIDMLQKQIQQEQILKNNQLFQRQPKQSLKR